MQVRLLGEVQLRTGARGKAREAFTARALRACCPVEVSRGSPEVIDSAAKIGMRHDPVNLGQYAILRTAHHPPPLVAAEGTKCTPAATPAMGGNGESDLGQCR